MIQVSSFGSSWVPGSQDPKVFERDGRVDLVLIKAAVTFF